jgi:hypothetical protein
MQISLFCRFMVFLPYVKITQRRSKTRRERSKQPVKIKTAASSMKSRVSQQHKARFQPGYPSRNKPGYQPKGAKGGAGRVCNRVPAVGGRLPRKQHSLRQVLTIVSVLARFRIHFSAPATPRPPFLFKLAAPWRVIRFVESWWREISVGLEARRGS